MSFPKLIRAAATVHGFLSDLHYEIARGLNMAADLVDQDREVAA